MSNRERTRTSSFGVSRRESHDASPFYDRFAPVAWSDDEEVRACPVRDQLFAGDARNMSEIPDKSVALVVTSPPYYAAKEYELAVSEGHVPSNFSEYLEMLRAVLDECKRVLEPGGRMAINVANLGRKPYRSLSADVIRMLQDDLGLLLRGEIIWRKGAGANGSCAWGSFMSAANPVLRDTSERIILASKGRMSRAVSIAKRKARGLPYESTISKEDFMRATLDVWEIPPESAKRVGHPAPFPVELPARLIQLFTYRGDTVLDPWMGSGSTALACKMLDRRFLGYDTEEEYVQLAWKRLGLSEHDAAP